MKGYKNFKELQSSQGVKVGRERITKNWKRKENNDRMADLETGLERNGQSLC